MIVWILLYVVAGFIFLGLQGWDRDWKTQVFTVVIWPVPILAVAVALASLPVLALTVLLFTLLPFRVR